MKLLDVLNKIAREKPLLLATGLMWASVLCQATPITYTINRTNGLGSLTGTLTTDGTIGALLSSSFVSTNLVVSGGTNSFNLVGITFTSSVPPAPGASIRAEVFGGLVASATQLTFDFGLSGAGFFMQKTFGNPQVIYCATSGFAQCGANEFFGAQGGIQNVDRWSGSASGNVLLGTVASGTATPEPGASVLVATGLAAFWLRKRNRVRS